MCFASDAFKVNSVTVERTEKPGISRMAVMVDGDHDPALRIEGNL